MTDKELCEKYLKSQARKVAENAEVITPEDIDQDFLLHISPNPRILKFIPVIGHRQANTEDRTVPRITTAPWLIGCLIGAANVDHKFHENKSDGSKDEDSYRGGFKIYEFELKAALKPNKKLVYDANASDECWLVNYSPQSREYQPKTAGRLFYKSITYTGRSGKLPEGEGVLYVEVVKKEGIRFSKNHFLSQGWWVITGPLQNHVR